MPARVERKGPFQGGKKKGKALRFGEAENLQGLLASDASLGKHGKYAHSMGKGTEKKYAEREPA